MDWLMWAVVLCLGVLGSQGARGMEAPGLNSLNDTQIAQEIDEFVAALMACNGVPGMTVAVSRASETVLARGYGVKSVETMAPMDSTTLVVIASLTKNFVSATMARVLEDHPEYTLDSSIRYILGDWFYAWDGYVSSKLRIRDALGHRSGFARHDETRIYGYSLQEQMRRLQYLENSEEFRDVHQYNNLMYSLSDLVIQNLTGRSWEANAQDFFLTPLSMDRTTFVQRAEEWWPEFATSYLLDLGDSGAIRPVSLEVPSAYYGPSSAPGGVSSNAEDMAKWIQFNLNNGATVDGQILVQPESLEANHEARATSSPTRYRRPNYPVTLTSEMVALGWFEGYYRGYRLSAHSGSQAGFLSQLSLLREADVGVYCTATGPLTDERDLLHMFIMDLMLGEEPWLDKDTVCDILPGLPRAAARGPSGQELLRSLEGVDGARVVLADLQETFCRQKEQDPTTDCGLIPLRDQIQTLMDAAVRRHQLRLAGEVKDAGSQDRGAGRVRRGSRSRRQEDFAGRYHHFGYGNLTVAVNETTGDLWMAYGPMATWQLEHYGDMTYVAVGDEPFWYKVNTVTFLMAEDDSGADRVLVNFDSRRPPTFVKDQTDAQAPAPPPLCDVISGADDTVKPRSVTLLAAALSVFYAMMTL